jgi:hypothetical protein
MKCACMADREEHHSRGAPADRRDGGSARPAAFRDNVIDGVVRPVLSNRFRSAHNAAR